MARSCERPGSAQLMHEAWSVKVDEGHSSTSGTEATRSLDVFKALAALVVPVFLTVQDKLLVGVFVMLCCLSWSCSLHIVPLEDHFKVSAMLLCPCIACHQSLQVPQHARLDWCIVPQR